MGSSRLNEDEESHVIRLPTQLLEQIKTKEDKGDYAEDESRYTKFDNKKKRKEKPVSRKEKRQQERKLKKQKKGKPTNIKVSSQATKPSKKNEEDPLAALKALKESKKKSQSSHGQESNKDAGLKILREEDLEDEGDFDEFDDDDSMDDFEDFEDFEEDAEMDAEEDPLAQLKKLKEAKKSKKEDPIAQLKALKEAKKSKSEDPIAQLKALKEAKKSKSEDPIAQLKALKEAKKAKESGSTKSKPKKSKNEKKQTEPRFISPQEREMMKRDEDDMAFYAKKLGLKSGKNAKLPKSGEDDMLGDILDGLDLDFGDNHEPETYDEVDKNGSSDDEISDVDLDEDELDEDESNELQDLGSESENIGADESDELDEQSDGFFSSDDEAPHKKENPYVAPVPQYSEEDDNLNDSNASQKYIPPALRRKLALESKDISAEVLNLQKSIKGPLNKLSEANISSIVNEISNLYMSNPRHLVSENLTSIVLESITQQGRLLDTFVYLHASLVVAIHRLQGVEFGALFIQTLVEKFDNYYEQPIKGKEISNIVSLLSAVYMFQLISSKLLYDVIKVLVNNLNENNAELLLRIIRTSGNQMRSDDPSALKEIVLLINKVSSSKSSGELNTRTQFLIETITSLKNNKLKVNNEGSHQLSIRLRKFLSSLNNNKFNDPMQVTLDDIHNIDTRGKWWLVGSAWKGHDSNKDDNHTNVNDLALNDILDNAEPNWMELARAQRMNTDIRRAVFVSIMSANDYIDALTKLDKLALKRSQEREIPRVLIHCTGVEPAWNPYYGVLASKICDNHSNRKTFQFMLWDLIKDFEGSDGYKSDEDEGFLGFDTNDEDDDSRLKRISNLGRLFGYLFAEGSLPLHALKPVNFLAASNDLILFLELMLVVFIDQIGKKSQINSVGAGLSGSKTGKKMFEQKYDDKLFIERLLKVQEQHTLMRGLQYFLQEKVKVSEFISGKKSHRRIEWGVDAMCDIIEEFLKTAENM